MVFCHKIRFLVISLFLIFGLIACADYDPNAKPEKRVSYGERKFGEYLGKQLEQQEKTRRETQKMKNR